MRSTFLSLVALANAVVVTETDYHTYYVTINGPAPSSKTGSSSGSSSGVPSSFPSSAAIATPIVASTTSAYDASETGDYESSWATSWSTTFEPSASPVATSSEVIPVPVHSTSSSSEVPTTSSSSSTSYVPSTTSTLSTASPTSTESALEKDILTYHNRVRAEHHVGSLTWNSTLAAFAQNYLDQDNCVFKHSGGPYGENIAIGYSTIDAAQDAWYNEEDLYNYTAGQFSEATGHFTQMVWKGTNQIGCATADCSGRTFLVCEYYPRGNIIGYFTENVFPK